VANITLALDTTLVHVYNRLMRTRMPLWGATMFWVHSIEGPILRVGVILIVIVVILVLLVVLLRVLVVAREGDPFVVLRRRWPAGRGRRTCPRKGGYLGWKIPSLCWADTRSCFFNRSDYFTLFVQPFGSYYHSCEEFRANDGPIIFATDSGGGGVR